MNKDVTYGSQGFTKVVELLAQQGITKGRVYLADASDWEAPEWKKQGYQPVYLPPTEEEWGRAFADAYEDQECRAFIVRDMSWLQDPAGLFLRLHAACDKLEIPLVVCCPNLGYRANAMSLLAGEWPAEQLDGRSFGYTKAVFEKWMEDQGFCLLDSNDYELDSPMQYLPLENTLLQPGNLANEYMSWLSAQFQVQGNCPLFVRCYKAGQAKGKTKETTPVQPAADGPFLTVVTRTQGKRIGELREALLCLTAQTDMDFELLIIGHKVSTRNKKNVESLIQEAPASLRDRTRYIGLDSGNRSAPLNLGFKLAKGQVVAVLDDDDLVTDDWVETFHSLYRENPGSVLHAYSVSQVWERGEKEEELRARSRPSAKYCKPFSLPRQLRTNYCPLMSLAFPAWLFKHSGIQFDESLDTTEDWDFLMRTALVAGVADSSKVTSLYRLWHNGDSSKQLHSQKQWDDNRHYVNRKLNQMPILMPPGSASELLRLYKESEEELKIGYRAVLFWDDGAGYSEENSIETDNLLKKPDFEYTFHMLPSEKHTGYLRFDPEIAGEIMVEDFSATLYSQDGRVVEVEKGDCISNGYLVEDTLVFPLYNPMIFIPVPAGFLVDDVVARGKLHSSIPDEMYTKILKPLGNHAILFGDDGSGYKEENSLKLPVSSTQEEFNQCFILPKDNQFQRELRYDPVDYGGVAVSEFEAELVGQDGQRVQVGQGQCRSNGVSAGGKFIFAKHDPQIYIPVPEGLSLTAVIAKGKLETKLEDGQLDAYILHSLVGGAGQPVLYGDDGLGYREEHIYKADNQAVPPEFTIEYQLEGTSFKGQLRFDPAETGGILLERFEAVLYDALGKAYPVELGRCRTNGYAVNGQLVFLKDDPQIYIPIPDQFVPSRVVVTGSMTTAIPDALVDRVVYGRFGFLVRRVLRKLKGMVRR